MLRLTFWFHHTTLGAAPFQPVNQVRVEPAQQDGGRCSDFKDKGGVTLQNEHQIGEVWEVPCLLDGRSQHIVQRRRRNAPRP